MTQEVDAALSSELAQNPLLLRQLVVQGQAYRYCDQKQKIPRLKYAAIRMGFYKAYVASSIRSNLDNETSSSDFFLNNLREAYRKRQWLLEVSKSYHREKQYADVLFFVSAGLAVWVPSLLRKPIFFGVSMFIFAVFMSLVKYDEHAHKEASLQSFSVVAPSLFSGLGVLGEASDRSISRIIPAVFCMMAGFFCIALKKMLSHDASSRGSLMGFPVPMLQSLVLGVGICLILTACWYAFVKPNCDEVSIKDRVCLDAAKGKTTPAGLACIQSLPPSYQEQPLGDQPAPSYQPPPPACENRTQPPPYSLNP